MDGIKIFGYTNYRSFLKDKYAELKQTNSAFSYRFFSKECGYSSPNFLKLVTDGKRNLSEDSIKRFSLFFKFDQKETKYFKNLVHFNQAQSSDEKKELAQVILKSTVFQRLNPLAKDQFEYYSNWYYVAIREILATKKIKLDAKSISELLIPTVPVNRVDKALETLLNLGMIKRKDNRYVQSVELVSTGDEVSSSAIAEHHREMFRLASDSIDTTDRALRDISGVTVSLSRESISDLKFMIQKFRKDVLELSERERCKESVYQVAIQMFPLSKVEELPE
jgi:uncharacterized protein (TIGR02147 family)